MNRLGSSVLAEHAAADASTRSSSASTPSPLDDLAELAAELFAPERLSAAGIGADEDVFRRALEPLALRLEAVA